jgi:hypothetical protein
MRGFGGVTNNVGVSYEWHLQSAMNGGKGGMRGLGNCYRMGKGVAMIPSHAVYWYERAAKDGDSRSCYLLALLYAGGIGGYDSNMALSQHWMQQAIEQKYELAIKPKAGIGCHCDCKHMTFLNHMIVDHYSHTPLKILLTHSDAPMLPPRTCYWRRSTMKNMEESTALVTPSSSTLQEVSITKREWIDVPVSIDHHQGASISLQVITTPLLKDPKKTLLPSHIMVACSSSNPDHRYVSVPLRFSPPFPVTRLH